MVIKEAVLETVIGVTTKTIPATGQPEIVFAGRSNAGKSSLINALMNRKHLARVSEVPGKTQTINFYHINKEFYFVDLPGYGYAKVKRDFRAEWGPMIEGYFESSEDLKAIFILIDIRRDPNEDDLMMYDWAVSSGFEPLIIATKSDKVKKQEKIRRINAIKKALGGEVNVLPFSSLDKSGRDEIYAEIERRIQNDKS